MRDEFLRVVELQDEGFPITHPFSQQLREYLQLGGSTATVTALLRLMLECSFSTMGVEQQHGSYATMRRLHPDYGLRTLAARGYLHSCRTLFSEDESVAALQKLQREQERLERKQPHKVGGRSMYLQRMLAKDELVVPEQEGHHPAAQTTPQTQQQQRLRVAQQLWLSMPAGEREQFDRMAVNYASAQKHAVEEQMQELTARRQLYETRLEDERATLRTRNMVSSCRLSAPDLDLFFQEYTKHQHQAQQFQSRMETLMEPPTEPTTSQMQLLRQHWPDPVRSEADKPPSWLKAVAAQRDLFTNAVFTQSAEQHSRAWFILYIKKSPVQAAVLELDVSMPMQLPATCCSRGDAWPPKFSTWSFACSAFRFSLLRSTFFQDGPIFVIPHCFWSQDCLVSLEGAFELQVWLECFRCQVRQGPRRDEEQEAPCHTGDARAPGQPPLDGYLSRIEHLIRLNLHSGVEFHSWSSSQQTPCQRA